jgi:DNA-binding NarL/FixJ family response regulator
VDLFVLDCSGLQDDDAQLVRQVRKACPNAGCIAIVREANKEQAARLAGANEVLCQGFETEQLLGAVRRIIQPQNQFSWSGNSNLA